MKLPRPFSSWSFFTVLGEQDNNISRNLQIENENFDFVAHESFELIAQVDIYDG